MDQGDGYIIEVKTDQKVALVVRSDSGERIYLPGNQGSDSTYYNEDPQFLENDSCGWKVRHPEEPETVNLIS